MRILWGFLALGFFLLFGDNFFSNAREPFFGGSFTLLLVGALFQTLSDLPFFWMSANIFWLNL